MLPGKLLAGSAMNYEPYRQAILKKVCEHCVDSDERGNCALTSGRQCGVELYLEAIVDVDALP